MNLQELHRRVENRLLSSPVSWNPHMELWSSEANFSQTIASNNQQYYLYLHALVSELMPRTIVELGTCLGDSALFMLLAMTANATLTTTDLGYHHPTYLGKALRDPRLRLITGDSCDPNVLRQVSATPIDLFFIDTDHTTSQAEKEWATYYPLMGPAQ